MKKPLALIITFDPSPDFFQHIEFFFQNFSQILIIDNNSNFDTRHRLKKESIDKKIMLDVIFNDKNLGVAVALNQGFQWAIENGFDYIFTFDQDSYPATGMVSAMLNALVSYKGVSKLALVASTAKDTSVGKQARFLRAKNKFFYEWRSCEMGELENLTFAITAGTLYNLSVYQKLGPFRDDFFIDYVDIEYCLRTNQKGYKIIATCNAFLEHRLGDREKRKLLGREHFPTFHPPLRWYYISRNRIPMLKKYAFRFPHWFSFEIISSTYILIRMLLFETQKTTKLRAVFLGTLDGLRGQMGKASETIIKKLENHE